MKKIRIKLTNRCNLHCAHCYNTDFGGGDITDDVFNRIVQCLSIFNPQNDLIIFHGGEPLIINHHNLKNYIDKIINLNYAYSFCTNLCYRLTQKILDIFTDAKFIETSWDYKIRFDSRYQKDLWRQNVLLLLSRGVDVRVSVTLTDQLINNVSPDTLFQMMLNMGVKHILLERPLPIGRAKTELQLFPYHNKLINYLLQCYSLSNTTNIKVQLFEDIKMSMQGQYYGCIGRVCHLQQFTFDVDGTLYSCPVQKQYALGHAESGINFTKMYNLTHRMHSMPTRCASCSFKCYCKGDCVEFNKNDICTIKPIYHMIYGLHSY